MAFAQEAALLKLDCRLVVPAQRWRRQLLVGGKPLGPDSGPGANAEWGRGPQDRDNNEVSGCQEKSFHCLDQGMCKRNEIW